MENVGHDVDMTRHRMNASHVMIGLALWAFSTMSAAAQTAADTHSSFLDFGVPCTDIYKEPQGPALLRANRSIPKSMPTAPLSQPVYPTISRRMGEQGRAVLKLLVSETGEVSQAHISESTSFPRLDAAALEVTRTWKFAPGKVDGKPRCMWGLFAVKFELTDYSEAELQAVTVSQEARTLADVLMGVDELRKAMFATELASPVERQILDLTLETARQRPEWVRAYDKVARILTIEFTAPELAELSRFFATPLASKLRSLEYKIMPAVMSEQRFVVETLMCSVGGVSQAMKDRELKLPEGSTHLSETQSSAVAAFVRESLPYCACAFSNMNQNGPGSSASAKQASDCGPPPVFPDAP